MNLEVGYEFVKDGSTYCLLDIINLNSKQYALFSEESKNEKLNFEFYEISEDANNFNFKKVTNENTNNMLLDYIERSSNGGNY
jgi:hypothetical protein